MAILKPFVCKRDENYRTLVMMCVCACEATYKAGDRQRRTQPRPDSQNTHLAMVFALCVKYMCSLFRLLFFLLPKLE